MEPQSLIQTAAGLFALAAIGGLPIPLMLVHASAAATGFALLIVHLYR